MLLRSPLSAVDDAAPFELKGSLFTLTVMHVFHLDRAAIERALAEKIRQAPSFFNNTPVVIDLDSLTGVGADNADFAGLYAALRGHGLVPVGIRNGSAELQAAAGQAGLPLQK